MRRTNFLSRLSALRLNGAGLTSPHDGQKGLGVQISVFRPFLLPLFDVLMPSPKKKPDKRQTKKDPQWEKERADGEMYRRDQIVQSPGKTRGQKKWALLAATVELPVGNRFDVELDAALGTTTRLPCAPE